MHRTTARLNSPTTPLGSQCPRNVESSIEADEGAEMGSGDSSEVLSPDENISLLDDDL